MNFQVSVWLALWLLPCIVSGFSAQRIKSHCQAKCLLPVRHVKAKSIVISVRRVSPLSLFTKKAAERDFSVETSSQPKASQILATIRVLNQQLERQKEDIRMTEMLLDRLEGTPHGYTGNSPSKDELTQLAASLVSGVDYGFVSRSEGTRANDIQGKLGMGPPANVWKLGWSQFFRNLNAMKGEYEEENAELTPDQKRLHQQLQSLTLNSTAIWQLEQNDGPIQAPWIIKAPYLVLCWFLDVLFEGNYVPSRFFLLETVARMPYFSYITMLHLYETLGFYRRAADVKRIHFAEEINEYRHLLIMESLGGDQQWWVRFVAQHSAIAYFVVLCILWMVSPSLSYKFSEMLETHAVHTYGQFLTENEAKLKKLPPSLAAIEYYAFGAADPFYGEFQTAALSTGGKVRRPGEDMTSLFDVFKAIRDDEGDHVSTMQACLDENVLLMSPSLEKKILIGAGIVAAASSLFAGGDLTGTSDLLSVNPGDIAVDGSGIELDALMAGATAVLSQVFGSGSEAAVESNELVGSAEAIESGVARFLGEGFAAGLLASKLLFGKEKEKMQMSEELETDEGGDTRNSDGVNND